MKKKQKPAPKAPQSPLTPEMDAYLEKAAAVFNGGIDRLAEAATAQVLPPADYIDSLCASAQRHQVSLQLDVREGQVSVMAHQTFGILPGEVGRGI